MFDKKQTLPGHITWFRWGMLFLFLDKEQRDESSDRYYTRSRRGSGSFSGSQCGKKHKPCHSDFENRKVFVYTEKDTFEIAEKLYVLEEQLYPYGFIRISKSMLLNFDQIYSFYPKLSGNLEALLLNQEKVIISRRYVAGLKRKLGMGENE